MKLDGRLRNASNNGEIAKVRELLEAGADPNAVGKQRHTALHLAVQGGHASVVAALVEASANPFYRAADLMSPLALAASRGQVDLVEALLRSRQWKPEVADLGNAVGWAIVAASVEILELLLAHGAALDVRDPEGRSALDHARWWRDEAHPDSKAKFDRIIEWLEQHHAV